RLSKATETSASLAWSPGKRLAIHLLTYYGWGKIDFGTEDKVLDIFFETAPVRVRAEAVRWVGTLNWSEGDDVESREQVVSRYRKLIERRIERFELHEDEEGSHELDAFGRWVISPYFGDDWALSQLERALQIRGRIESDSL